MTTKEIRLHSKHDKIWTELKKYKWHEWQYRNGWGLYPRAVNVRQSSRVKLTKKLEQLWLFSWNTPAHLRQYTELNPPGVGCQLIWTGWKDILHWVFWGWASLMHYCDYFNFYSCILTEARLAISTQLVTLWTSTMEGCLGIDTCLWTSTVFQLAFINICKRHSMTRQFMTLSQLELVFINVLKSFPQFPIFPWYCN